VDGFHESLDRPVAEPAFGVAVTQIPLQQDPLQPVDAELRHTEPVPLGLSLPLVVAEPDPGFFGRTRRGGLDLHRPIEDVEQWLHGVRLVEGHQLSGVVRQLFADLRDLLLGQHRSGVRAPVGLPRWDLIGQWVRLHLLIRAQHDPGDGFPADLFEWVRALRQVLHLGAVSMLSHTDRQNFDETPAPDVYLPGRRIGHRQQATRIHGEQHLGRRYDLTPPGLRVVRVRRANAVLDRGANRIHTSIAPDHVGHSTTAPTMVACLRS